MRFVPSDLLQAWRRLRQGPGSTLLAVLTLALAIGAGTAVFSIVEAVLLRPFPFADPDRLLVVWEDHSRSGGTAQGNVAPATLADLQHSQAFAAMCAQLATPLNLTGRGEAESLSGARVTANFFAVLGTDPMLGRAFRGGEDRPSAERVVILSHALWQRRFGGERRILGQALELDGALYTVVGVMPPAFEVPLFFVTPKQSAELWVPLILPEEMNNHATRVLQVVGRLAPAATPAAAGAAAAAVAQRLAADFPATDKGVSFGLVPIAEQIAGGVRPVLLVLSGAVAFVLLIACANVASLLLAKALGRRRELSIRAALGAGRRRLVVQMLYEGLLLAAAGGLGGILLAFWGIRLLPRLVPADVPRLSGLHLDGAVLLYCLGASILTGVACGIFPALRAARVDLLAALQEDAGRSGSPGEHRTRLRNFLVIGQIALTLLLLVGAGLLSQSFLRLRAVRPGFQADKLLTLKLALPEKEYSEPRRQVAFFEELLRRIESLPGVVAAGAITRLPLDASWGFGPLGIEDKPLPVGERPMVGARTVTAGYFRAMGIPLLAGRLLEDRDRDGSPLVVLVNQRLAHTFWPGKDPVGRRLQIGSSAKAPWRQVVGVVGDVVHDSLAAAPLPEIYMPHTQVPSDWFQIVVRTSGDPLAAAAAVRREVGGLDRNLPVVGLQAMRQHVDSAIAGPRFSMLLLGGFAVLALVLATLGVFGLMAYTVQERTQEIGLRMALGAQPGSVLGLVLGQSCRLAAAGVVLGLGGALALTRWLAGQLFGIGATDPATFAAGTALVVAASLLAAFLPALRATRLPAADSLRRG